MNWKQIDKKTRVQNTGVYNDWKQQIADECYNQCVYCSIHEGPWGGIDHYHIDHFRPKSKYPDLENTISNLYYACPVCNRFKSDNWENEPNDLNQVCYPDPSDHNYSDLFTLMPDHILEGRYVASNFLVNRLYLNRPQLVYDRREYILKIKAKQVIDTAKALLNQCEDFELIKKISLLLAELSTHLHNRTNIIPYKLVEIQKPAKNER